MRLRFFKGNYQWYFPLFIGVSLITGCVISFIVYHIADEAGRNSLIYRSETLAHALDGEEIQALTGMETDIGAPEYENLKRKLVSIRESNPDTRFIYIVGKRAGEVFFYVDSESPESEDYSPPGEVYYEESEAFDKAFNGTDATEGPVKDRWGSWISAASPITDASTGQVIAVIGIDVDATSYMRANMTYAAIPLLIALSFALFAYVGLRIKRGEEKLIELKSQFVTIASHELRSPLTGIRWVVSSLVEANDISEPHKIELSRIEASTNRLVATVNDILKAASFETQKEQLPQQSINLSDVMTRIVIDSASVAKERDIAITFANKIPQEAYAKGDESMMFEAISNILSNAIKYSPKESVVTITYSAEAQMHCVEIEDKGIGIPQAEVKKVFDGFYRAQNARKMTVNGSGLGLYFVKKIIEAHQGTIRLESQEGKGTKVIICLPKARKI